MKFKLRIFFVLTIIIIYICMAFLVDCPQFSSPSVPPPPGSLMCGYYIHDNWNYYINPLSIGVVLVAFYLLWPLRKKS